MDAFPIAPAEGRALWLLLLLPALVMAFVVYLLGSSALASRRAQFEVSDQGLRLRGDAFLSALRRHAGVR